MSSRENLTRLHANRLMRSPEEVAAFEEALSAIAQAPRAEWLEELHLALDDRCAHHEVMFGLVHLLESFELDTQLRAMLSVLPVLSKQAPDWARILHYRILNDDQARGRLEQLLLEESGEGAIISKKILKQVAEEGREPVSGLARAVLRATGEPVDIS